MIFVVYTTGEDFVSGGVDLLLANYETTTFIFVTCYFTPPEEILIFMVYTNGEDFDFRGYTTGGDFAFGCVDLHHQRGF